MTTPYDPQYGTPQGGSGYGTPQGGPGYGTPQGGPGYGTQPGGQPYGTPPGGPGYGQPGQPGMPGADPYAGAQTGGPGAGAYGGAQTGYPGYQQPGQSGFAAVNQLPGQPLAVIARKRAIKMTLIGAVIFVIGLIITIATYSAASSGGGTYVVAWGPMIVGLVWTIRGLMSLSRASKL
jgi:hypothetical protein